MPHLPDERKFLDKQYRDSSNLDARVNLHRLFGTNPYGWHLWIFDHFALTSRCQVLELGCGPAYLWQENLDRIPAGWEITLSDISSGMLEDARRKLCSHPRFRFQVIDAQSIPFGEASFDAVIANHMLYHVPDRQKALREIHRILKPAGSFFASTVGEKHLVEVGVLIRKFDPGFVPVGQMVNSFTLENGSAQLSDLFTDLKVFHYPNALEVTEVFPLVDYIFSGRTSIPVIKRAAFRQFVAEEMQVRGGVIHITIDAGLFVSSRKERVL
jgi:SAM-dependent methyltransferase